MEMTTISNYLVICVITIGIIVLFILALMLIEDHRKIYADMDFYLISVLAKSPRKIGGITPTDYYLLRKEIDGNGNKINSYFDGMF